MKKINIKDIELNIDIIRILELKNGNYNILIDIDGKIYIDSNELINKAIIFSNSNYVRDEKVNDIKELCTDIFKAYKPVIIGATCKIKPVINWQNIIGMNTKTMLYYDHQSDGVELFEDKLLEDYGWHASALEINYRELSDFIEENCEGLLLCYDNNIQFNGFVIADDIDTLREQVKAYIIKKTKENVSNDELELDDGDVVEALEYFKIKVG
jgi:hypothetical protein